MNINQQQEKVEPINQATFDEEELISVLRNTHENQQQDPEPQIPSTRTSMADIDVEERQCPMCYWQFPENMTLDGKREHIEQHFQ